MRASRQIEQRCSGPTWVRLPASRSARSRVCESPIPYPRRAAYTVRARPILSHDRRNHSWLSLAGSIPFALILARRSGAHDPRRVGSGNLGAANVARTAGVSTGLAVALLDAAKGAASVLVAESLHASAATAAAAGLAAIVGHIILCGSASAAGRAWRRRAASLSVLGSNAARGGSGACDFHDHRSGSRATCRWDRSPPRSRCRLLPMSRAAHGRRWPQRWQRRR